MHYTFSDFFLFCSILNCMKFLPFNEKTLQIEILSYIQHQYKIKIKHANQALSLNYDFFPEGEQGDIRMPLCGILSKCISFVVLLLLLCAQGKKEIHFIKMLGVLRIFENHDAMIFQVFSAYLIETSLCRFSRS